MRLYFLCALLLGGCIPSLTAFRGDHDSVIDDLRMEIADLKHALHGTDVEVKLLEERIESAEESKAHIKTEETTDLKRKLFALEKSLDKMNGEIRTLMNTANQTASSLATYRQQLLEIDSKLIEVSKLRSTLSQLSHSSRPQEAPPTYRVKPGDSLSKIALKYGVTTDSLKRENQLETDTIVVDQLLKIPKC